MGPTALILLSMSNQQVDGLQASQGAVLGRITAQTQDACMGGLIAASDELVKVGLSVKSLPPCSQ